MTTFIEFLDELEQSHQTVELPAAEVERLASRFGPAVRSMGFRNAHGAVEIPIGNITEALRVLNESDLSVAVSELKESERLTGALGGRCASRLIETLARLYLDQFQKRVARFQDSTDPAETDRLWSSITRDLFGA